MNLQSPFPIDANPLGDRRIDPDIASAVLVLAALGFYAAPLGTGLLIGTIIGIVLTHRSGQWLSRHFDGRHRTVSVPGVGTLHLHFSSR